MVWTNISSVSFGTPPSPRFHHGFTVSDGKLYVFGGCNDASGAIDGGPGTNDGSTKEGRGGWGGGSGESESEREREAFMMISFTCFSSKHLFCGYCKASTISRSKEVYE